MFQRLIITSLSFGLAVTLGFMWPDGLLGLLKGVGAAKDWLITELNITGHIALMFELGGATLALVLAVIGLTVGLLLRQLSSRFLRWSHLVVATLLPLVAHAVEWSLGLFTPALLVPVHELSDWLLTQLTSTWQVRLNLLGARELLEITIISIFLLLVWQGLKLVMRQFRRPTSTTTPSSGGSRRNAVMRIVSKLKRLVTLPWRLVFGSTTSGYEKKYTLLGWKRTGFWLGPLQAFLLFVLASLLVSFGGAWLVLLVLNLVNEPFFSNASVWWALFSGLCISFILLGWLVTERRSVPNNHVAVLEILGYAIPVYLEMGKYIIPFASVFSTNRDLVLGPVYETQESNLANPGLVFTGNVTVILDDEQTQGDMMQAIAADGAANTLLPTFRYTCNNPRQRLGQNQPIKDLNKASREVIRKIVGGSTSAPMMLYLQGAVAETAAGGEMIFIRTQRSSASTGVHMADLVVHKATRRPILEIIHPEDPDRDTIIKEFKQDVIEHGDEDMIRASCAKVANDVACDHKTMVVSTLFVGKAVAEALRENGYMFNGLPRISEIDTPEQVKIANARRAAEVPQRDAALADAETVHQQGKILQTAGLKGEDAAWAAFLRENPEAGQAIHISGSGAGSGVIVNTDKK